MSSYLKEFIFEKSPKEITYLEEEPLKLTKNLHFFIIKVNFGKNYHVSSILLNLLQKTLS